MRSDASGALILINHPLAWVGVPCLISTIGSTFALYFPELAQAIIIPTAIGVFGWWIAAIARVFVGLFRRQWGRAAGRWLQWCVSVPLAIIGLGAGDHIHLVASYPYYLREIERTPERPVRFDWGKFGGQVPGYVHMRTLLYDVSGSAEAATATRSQDAGRPWVRTVHLMGNFFVEERTSD